MKSKYLVKNLIVLAICASILLAITAYMALAINEVNESLASTQDALATTQNELSSIYKSLSTSQSDFETARDALISEQDKNSLLQAELDAANTMISDLKSNEYELVYIGNYKLTHYCTEERTHICGTGAGITSTGTQVTAGRTIAVDPSVIPYGTEVYIEGYGWRVAEDCGGAVNGKHIDIAVETHSQALSMGTATGGVWILVKKGS
jgi:3D (Asp-Asp-Asp) domain-containing protein